MITERDQRDVLTPEAAANDDISFFETEDVVQLSQRYLPLRDAKNPGGGFNCKGVRQSEGRSGTFEFRST